MFGHEHHVQTFRGRCDAMTRTPPRRRSHGGAEPAGHSIRRKPWQSHSGHSRNGDEVWIDIIGWLHYGLIEAEAQVATNADEMSKSPRRRSASAPAPR